ncbi:MAG: NADH-quinone oxidoreductase subunit L [Gemmatimonadetes bacterium]|nr:MAG: NADH-quinone oxidoreductase subunit L [Gemmatimonadota bacterium]
MRDIIWLIPILPLLGAAINGFFGKKVQTTFGKTPIHLLACGTVGLSFILASWNFFYMLSLEPASRHYITYLYTWFRVGDLIADVSFLVDPLSSLMILIVTGVGFLIHIFSIGYMAHDTSYYRYFTYLNLFMFSMLTLVLGSNLFLMFIGWEGVGLCSYLLIGFWFDDTAKAKAGMKAFITNRIGDLGFLAGIMLLFWSLGNVGIWTVDFYELGQYAHLLDGMKFWGLPVVTLITLFFFIGATGKSAQIPLYVWLPDAMAGPTPVSALIHAATMVTAGVYMIGRLNFLYTLAPATLAVVASVGAITAIFAASIGLVQNDIKKVLAYSTVSQLGYMFLGMGVAAYSAGIFHLMTHAFFKACLFLGSGAVIHALDGEQDIRRMGNLRRHMPYTTWTFVIATLAISGIPGFSGFFSKDEILWKAYSSPHGHWLLWLIGAIAAGMTAFYMWRLVFLTFFGNSRLTEHAQKHIHPEHLNTLTIPLIVLAFLAIVGGYVGIPAALGGGNHIEHFLEPVFHSPHTSLIGHETPLTELTAGNVHGEGIEHKKPAMAEHVTTTPVHKSDAHHHDPMEYILMGLSVLIALAGIGLAYLMYLKKTDLPAAISAKFRFIYKTLYNKYWVDEIYGATVIGGAIRLSKALATFDLKIIDGIVNGVATIVRYISWLEGKFDTYVVDGVVNGVANAVQLMGGRVRKLQSGFVENYVYLLFVGLLVLIFIQLN